MFHPKLVIKTFQRTLCVFTVQNYVSTFLRFKDDVICSWVIVSIARCNNSSLYICFKTEAFVGFNEHCEKIV